MLPLHLDYVIETRLRMNSGMSIHIHSVSDVSKSTLRQERMTVVKYKTKSVSSFFLGSRRCLMSILMPSSIIFLFRRFSEKSKTWNLRLTMFVT